MHCRMFADMSWLSCVSRCFLASILPTRAIVLRNPQLISNERLSAWCKQETLMKESSSGGSPSIPHCCWLYDPTKQASGQKQLACQC